jgi:hypothetical protein
MTTITTIDYEARVAKGIALLDEKFPDWAGLINLDTLSLSSTSDCVTAQLAHAKGKGSTYFTGMEMLGLTQGIGDVGSYTQHGFNVETADRDELPPDYELPLAYDPYEGYKLLNQIWKREIKARQLAATADA